MGEGAMTLDNIIQVAREVGFSIKVEDVDKFERFATLVAAAEREACADIASTCCEGCADDIRARGESK
jgi:hypothetical protein